MSEDFAAEWDAYRDAVWIGRLDAKMHTRYCQRLLDVWRATSLLLRFLTALASSATFVALLQDANGWTTVLAASAAIAAVVAAITTGFEERLRSAAVAWSKRSSLYDDAWDLVRSGSWDVDTAAMRRADETVREAHAIPRVGRLFGQAQAAVRRAEGIA